jgi:very-short-patch-repair endonuclease
MAAVALVMDEGDICKRYLAGETVAIIAASWNCSTNSIWRVIGRNGVQPCQRRKSLDVPSIIAAYGSGESEKSIADRLGISRNVIRRRLLESGVQPRNRSAGMFARMARTSPEDRRKLSEAAHAAIRGKPQSEEQRRKIAATNQSSVARRSEEEICLGLALLDNGLTVTPQQAVGRYNVDLAIDEGRIAVEILGGCWHGSGSHAARFRKRTDYLIDAGWLPVIIWAGSGRPISAGAIEYLVSLSQAASRNEAARGQEHVIDGAGKPTAIGESHLNYRAAVGGDKCGPVVRGNDGRWGH